MSPRRPIYAPGYYYHLYNRGAHREPIFHEQDNYFFVLREMKRVSRAYKLTIIAYCLLPNHYHFLVRQDGDAPAGSLPQHVFNSYSKAYNKRYCHSGTLFEGPYRVHLVDSQLYLLHLCRYIHANPVRHGLVARIEEWPYSNYPEWIGAREGIMVDREFIRDCFGTAEQYRSYVADYLTNPELPEALQRWLVELEV